MSDEFQDFDEGLRALLYACENQNHKSEDALIAVLDATRARQADIAAANARWKERVAAVVEAKPVASIPLDASPVGWPPHIPNGQGGDPRVAVDNLRRQGVN